MTSMTNGIYLPPWLQPVDRIGPFMQGVSQGVNMARTALAAQAQAFEAQQAQQQLALRQQQEERAVATAVAGVIAQKEEQKRQQAIVEMKAQQAARQFSAQMDYEQAVQAGEDPAKALMRIGPRMGINPSAVAGRMIAQQARPEAQVKEFSFGGRNVSGLVQPSGTVTFPPTERRQYETPEQRAKRASLMAEFNAANKSFEDAKWMQPKTPEEGSRRTDLMMGAEREKDRIRKELDKLYAEPEPPKQAGGRELDEAMAKAFLRQAGGDKTKARRLAREAGYTF